MKLSNKRYKRSLSHIITDSAKKSSITNEKKCSIQASSSATVVSASSTKSSFTVLPSLRRSMKKKLQKQKSSTRTSSSSQSSLSLSLQRHRSKKLQKESTAHTTSSSALCEIEEDVPYEAEDTIDTLLESKPSEMKAEDEETTPTLETSAPFVQPTLFDHITNVTDSMIDLVESLSTEAEETKEPEDAKVEEMRLLTPRRMVHILPPRMKRLLLLRTSLHPCLHPYQKKISFLTLRLCTYK